VKLAVEQRERVVQVVVVQVPVSVDAEAKRPHPEQQWHCHLRDIRRHRRIEIDRSNATHERLQARDSGGRIHVAVRKTRRYMLAPEYPQPGQKKIDRESGERPDGHSEKWSPHAYW